MTDPAVDVVMTENWSELDHFRARQWTSNDLSWRWMGGIVWTAAIRAAAAFMLAAAAGALLLGVIGLGWWWGLVVGMIAMVVVYRKYAREPDGGLSTEERWRLRRNWARQPKILAGLSAVPEPTDIEWSLVLWRPNPAARPFRGTAKTQKG